MVDQFDFLIRAEDSRVGLRDWVKIDCSREEGVSLEEHFTRVLLRTGYRWAQFILIGWREMKYEGETERKTMRIADVQHIRRILGGRAVVKEHSEHDRSYPGKKWMSVRLSIYRA
jgi:hypothetical protein